MAERDGTIVIDTQIDTKGVDAGSEKTEASLRRMAKKVNDIGATAKAALNKQIDAFARLNSQYDSQSEKIDALKRKIAGYSDEYGEMQAKIDETVKKLNDLEMMQGVIKDAVKDSAKRGTTFDTTQYKWVQEDIEKLAKEIEVAEREQDKLFATGKPFELGSKARAAKEDLEKLSQEEGKLADMHNKLQTAYDGVNDKINEYSQKADEATASTSRLSRIGGMVGKAIGSIATFGKNAAKSLTGAKKSSSGFGLSLGTLVKYGFGIRSLENKIKEAGGNVVDGILLGILDALLGIGSWIVDNVFKPILDGFKNAFGIHSPSTVMQEQGHYIIEGLLLGITDFLSKIKKKFEEIRNIVTEKMDNIKSSAVSKVNEMKKGLSDGVGRIKESFRSGFSTLVGYVKSPINSIIRFINNFLYAIQTMQNSFANALNSMSISLPHWLEKLTGFSSVGFNVGYWSAPMVPYLAQGAVIPPNKEFMAVLGDQKNGNNIEAPESLIRRIVREESGNNGTRRIEVPVYLNRREIARAVLEEGRCLRTVTGRNPFELI